MKTLLGQRIREQRRKKGWTMDKLAEKADLSVNYVGDLERGVEDAKPVRFHPYRCSIGCSRRCADPGHRSPSILCGR